MFKQLLLCFLVGLAAATSSDYAWKSNTEYEYEIQGRTMAGLHEVADQYAGVLMQAKLSLQRRAEGVLIGRVSKAQYAQVHSVLPDGWDSDIPENKLNYQQLPLSQKPFEVRFKNGTVQELIVEQDISNWEANVLKSIVSQIQIDVQGENSVESRYNRYGENDAMFKTMEDTVTGKCLTMYDINELPEYILQAKPELVPMPHLKGEGDFIEVVKTLNYSDCKERIAYHYGLHEMEDMEPSSARMGDYFSRSSVSRVVLSGSLKRHTIQSSVTTNKIVIKPTPSSNQKGLVVSQLNITLVDVHSAEHEPQQLSQPKSIGNLVYKYNAPFAQTNQVRSGSKNSEEQREEQYYRSSSEEEKYFHRRHPRSLQLNDEENESTSSTSEEDLQNWKQNKPSMTSEPETPLMPYFIGYQGQAIKSSKQINPVEAVQKLAHKIARELEQPSEMTKEDTLATFTILTRLVRTMNVREIEEAGRELYSHSNKEVSYHVDAWKTYRDAVAQAGTGPALMTIQDWILTKKIQGQEAATVLSTVANSVRHPTQEYMKTYYTLATKQEVQKQAYLNDTAILSYSDLVRKVIVDDEYSHNEYPVHAFGKYAQEYKQYLKSEFIPYLKHQLERAIEQADSHKIHVYIRALGNVAHRQILAVFEPYLEGKKDVSEFQRLFMVMSLDQLAYVEPKVTRTVLYKIYQNQGEQTEVRVAAVYQLMKTNPPVDMLQRMAEMTNEDSDDDVNAVVKSVIENAAKLQDPEYSELAEAAQSATPLLNPTPYGVQYSHQHLKDYVAREMNIVYKQKFSYIGSEDSIWPQAILYNLRSNMGGVQRHHVNLVAMVNSVEQLFKVFEQQTEKYQPEQYRSAKKESKWASEQISKLLNIDEDLNEELEGNVLLGMGQIQRFFTFDNQTIEQLPEYLKDWSSELRKGYNFNLTKWLNPREYTLSFPTIMGIPFVYTLETPVLVSLNGEVRVKTQPELVSRNEVRMPETLNLTSKIEVLVSSKTQSKIGFVTPFDHQRYIAGYDKHVQVYLPVEIAVDVDFENNDIRMEVQPIENQKNEHIFHYSSTPYTAKKDLLQLKPVSQMPTHKIVHVREQKHYEQVYGEKKGMAFHVKYTGENKYMDCEWIHQAIKEHQGLSSVFVPLTEDYLTPFNLSVKYDAERTSAKSVVMQLSWNQTHFSGKHQYQQPNFDDIFEIREEVEQDQEKRQEYFMKKATHGISSVDGTVFDFALQFVNKKHQPITSFNTTVAVATSPVDKHSRFIVYYNKEADHEKDFQVCLTADNQFPNTNGLDYEYALQFDPTSTLNVQLAYGEQCKTGSKVNLKGKLYQSEERKQYLKNDPMTKICKREMQEGNKQLEGCRNMTLRANFMDRLTLDIKYDGISQYVRNLTYKTYSVARYMGFHYIDEDIFEGHGQKDQIKFLGRIEPDYQSLNLTLLTEKTKTEYKNIRIVPYLRPVFAVHPVFPLSDRVYGWAQQTNFRPTCVVDVTAANTFDNLTYPITLGNTWHVVMHYRANSQIEQRFNKRFESEGDYDYVVLARETGNNKKEIKIVVNDEKNYWEIDMLPEPQQPRQLGQVRINGKQIQFDDEHSYDLEDAEIAQVYALPNGEIKVELNGDLYLIYDGERVKLTTTDDKFRGQVYGLCGTFDGQQETDFTTPKQCILENEREFVATYAVIDESSKGPAAELQKKALKAKCYEKETLYSNVITRRDIYGNKHHQKENEHEHRRHHNSCSKHQTQYVEDEQTNEICFTIRPIPVCSSPCKASKKIVKNVDVHCVQKSNVSSMWKKQIDMGSSPDFGLKPVHKQIKIKVAQTCAA